MLSRSALFLWKRAYSSANASSTAKSSGAPLSAANIDVQMVLAANKKQRPANKDLIFGHSFTDHMLTIEWTAEKGWDKPKIQPYGKLHLDPSAVVLHYGVECFEGMKAYIDKNNKIRMFRPDMNMNRLHKSMQRLALPSFDRTELLECIKKLLVVDKEWIPKKRGYSLYIRPTAIGTQHTLGVGPTNKALLFVICSPVGPYYKTGFSAVSLYASKKYVRAWPGGTGDAKIGGNYAPGIRPQIDVAKDGYQQILWLFGQNDNVTEVGTMNLFIYWKNESGQHELVTPPLDGTILPGVTRDSILTLARQWSTTSQIPITHVSERAVSIREIAKASSEGRLVEMFGAGTAAIVSPIKKVHYDGHDIHVPLDPKDKTQQAGPLTRRFAEAIMGIQYGEVPNKWSVVID